MKLSKKIKQLISMALTVCFLLTFVQMTAAASDEDPSTYAGTNLAYGKTVTVSSVHHETLAGEYATDGNYEENKYWTPERHKGDQWITVDLGDVYSINEVYLHMEEIPTYQILVSTDGVVYTPVATVTDGDYEYAYVKKTFEFRTVDAQYVRFLQQAEGKGGDGWEWGVALVELEVYYRDRGEEADVTELQALISEIQALDLSACTESSVTALNSALAEAKTILENIRCTQEDVDNATLSLKTAKDGLVYLSGHEVNIAYHKDVEVSSIYGDVRLGEYAVDGLVKEIKEGEFWAPVRHAGDQWITIDLGALYAVNEVLLYMEEVPTYQILVSKDNEKFDVVVDVTDGGNTYVHKKSLTFPVTEARYVKFLQKEERLDADGGKYGASIVEFKVQYNAIANLRTTIEELEALDTTKYTELSVLALTEALTEAKAVLNTSGVTADAAEAAVADLTKAANNLVKCVIDTNLARGKTVSVSSTYHETLVGEYATDGNYEENKYWTPERHKGDQWITVDLGDVYAVNEVYLHMEEIPTYQILVSTDGVDYTPVVTVTDGDNEFGYVKKTFEFRTVDARYIRFLQQAEGKGGDGWLWGVSLVELEVYYRYRKEAQIMLNNVKSVPPTISDDGTRIVLPEFENEDYELKLYGSSNEAVIGLDGTIYTPLTDTTVKVMYQIVNKEDPTDKAVDEYTEVEITVLGQYDTEDGDNQKPNVLPEIREWKGYTGNFTLSDTSRLVIGDENLRETAQVIAYYFKEMLGRDIETATGEPTDGDIYITLENKPELSEEGYTVEIGDIVKVEANAAKGALYAGTTLTQILSQDENGAILPKGLIRDYPAYEVRSIMLDLGRMYIPLDYVEEITKYMAYFKCSEIHLHINDTGGEQYTAFRLESKNYPQANKSCNGNFYTQEAYRNYQKEVAKFGITVITEIDTPAHSAFAGYFGPDYVLEANSNCLNLENEKVIELIKGLFNEFMDGEDPVIQSPVVHLGADEYMTYSGEFEKYRQIAGDYILDITNYVMEKGYDCRIWNMIGSEKYPIVKELNTNVALQYFASGHANYDECIEEGFPIINSDCNLSYIVPSPFATYANHKTVEYLYNTWNVNNLHSIELAESSPLLLGQDACFWYDYKTGYSETDTFNAMKKMILIVAEKTWYGNKEADTDSEKASNAEDFINRATLLGTHAPGANPGRFVESTGNLVAEYDFETINDTVVTDNSNNNYDAQIHGLEIVTENGNSVAILNGEGYMSLPFNSLGYPYSVSFDIYVDETTPENAVLFSGADGTLYLNHNGTGKIMYTRKGYTFVFDYELSANEWHNITISCNVGDLKTISKETPIFTQLYVDGAYICSGSDEAEQYLYSSTFVVPTEKIGEGVIGKLDNLRFFKGIYLESLIAEVDGMDMSKYTDETAENLSTALENAKEVYGNSSSSEDEINEAAANLYAAKAALEYKKSAEYTASVSYTLGRDAEYSYIYNVDADGSVVYDNRAVINIINSEGTVVHTTVESEDNLTSDENGKAVINLSVKLSDGTYTVVFTKNGYKRTSAEFEIAGGDVVLGSIKPSSGDIKGDYNDPCGDGVVDIDDFIRVLRGFSNDCSDILRMSVDINEDGVINVDDIAIIKASLGR